MWWVLRMALASESGFDHQHTVLRTFLDGAVNGLSVNYGVLETRRTLLTLYLDDVASLPMVGLSHDTEVAVWVNAYNACTVRLVLDHRPLTSIKDLDGGKTWDVARCTVGGKAYTLNEIENDKLRPIVDGRIHAVLNCAARGCAPLPPRPVVPQDLNSQLDTASRRWVASNAVDRSGGRLALSEIFRWYAADFDSPGGVVPLADAAQSGALRFIAAHGDSATVTAVLAGTVAPSWNPYDWALNGR